MTFTSYSQNGEDVLLWRALSHVEDGFYVDVGAADPTEFSVTRGFYDRGWHGINCEPAEHYARALLAERPRDLTLRVAVGRAAGRLAFHRIADTGLSTLDAEVAAGHARAGWRVEDAEVEVTTLAALLARHAPPVIHFLKIDVEGAEADVVAGADFSVHRPWIILLEATRPLSDAQSHALWEPALLEAGYAFVWFDGLNRFYVAAEHEATLRPHFAVQPNVLDDVTRFDSKAEARVSEAVRALERREAEFARERRWLLDERRPMLAEMTWLRDLNDQLHREAEGLRQFGAAIREEMADRRSELTALRAEAGGSALAALRAELAQERARADAQVRTAEELRAAFAPAQGALRAAQDEIASLSRFVARLDRLARELRWEDGPRVLQPVLPLARLLRRLVGSRPAPARAVPIALGAPVAPAALVAPAAPGAPAAAVALAAPMARAPAPLALPSPMPEPAATPGPHAPMLQAPMLHAPMLHAPRLPRRAVHQFHSGSSLADAITNAMRLTRSVLRALGYDSEIYVEHRDPRLADELLLLEDIPAHDDYVLIVRHSMGFDAFDRVAALAAPKVLLYHNITPSALLAHSPFLARYAELGRQQLAAWRPRVMGALADSEYNALELRALGYETALACPLLFDVEALRTEARGRRAAPDPQADPRFTVLFVGRVTPAKGQAELVEAFAAFRAEYAAPCRLVLVGRTAGSEDYVREIERRAFRHGVEADVLLTGEVDDAALHAWYGRADLYASLSSHEGFGVPLVEAMAHGLPVVAFATGAVPATLGEGGVLVEDAQPATLARAMLRMAGDPEARAAVLARQEERLAGFRLSRQVPVLAQALALAGAAPPVAPATRAAMAASLHVTVAGHVNKTYSLAVVNRVLASALEARLPGRVRLLPVEGVPTLALDEVPAGELDAVRRLARREAPRTGPHVVISQHYPLHVPEEPNDAALAYVFWEESLVPRAVIATLNASFRGVLAPTRAVAEALVTSGLRVPVRVVGFAPPLDPHAALARGRVAVSPSRGTPLTFLHVSSCFPRKGVDLLLAAWVQAFRARDPVRLVIKGFPNPHNDVAAQLRAMRARHTDMAPVELIDADLDAAAMLALYARAQVAVLPTRGEGFNIPAAEALAAGLRLIVTGAGGHMDFLGEGEARLLAWRHAASRSHLGGQGSTWLEPDLDDLVAALREALAGATAAGSDGEPARREAAGLAVRRRLDPARFAARVVEASVDLLLAPPARPLRVGWVTSWAVRCGIAEYSRQLLDAGTQAADSVVFADDRTAALPVAAGDGAGAAAGAAAGLGEAAGPRVGPRVVPSWELGETASIPRLLSAIAREDPQVLVVQHQPGLMRWPALAQLLQDPRLRARVSVVTLHNTRHLLELEAGERAVAIEGLRHATRVCVHTLADLAALQAEGLDRLVLMPQGAPPPLAQRTPRVLPGSAAPVIGCYGFLLPPKGIPRLLRACALLRREWPGLRLRLVTALYPADESVMELAQCRALAASLGLGEAVEWVTDFLPHADCLERLAGCDLIVLPYAATRESSSAALRTALASLTPVLVTPIAIFAEAGEAVARAEGETPERIAAGMRALLRDATARTQLQHHAWAWLEARAWPVVAERMAGMLAGLVAGRHAAATVGAMTSDWGKADWGEAAWGEAAAAEALPAIVPRSREAAVALLAAPASPRRAGAADPPMPPLPDGAAAAPQDERAGADQDGGEGACGWPQDGGTGEDAVPAAPWDIPYRNVATAEDIFYCFRLLLGRHPHRADWQGHASRAGEALPEVVASYLDSLEFARRELTRHPDMPEVVESEHEGFRLYSAADDLAVGRYVRADNYEREVAAVFRRLLRPGMGVLDVGANIGYFTMLSASLVGPTGHVIAVEPNPRNVRLLEASRRLNGFAQVSLLQVAAGRETGLLTLNTSHSNGTTSELGGSLRAVLAAQTIPALRLDGVIGPERRINLIKIDVEGAEYNALLGARETIARFRPTILSEFSPDLMPGISGIDGEGYLTWIIDQGYRLSVIRPDGTLSAPEENWHHVMAEYRARGTDHLDIVATPL